MAVRYRVRASGPLHGTAVVQGAKNAVLPMIAASLLASKGRTVLRNVPDISDVANAVDLARAVGADVERLAAEQMLIIDATNVSKSLLPADITRQFRGSVLFLSPVLYRCGEVAYEGAGGCNLGARDLDWHYRGLARLGAQIDDLGKTIHIRAGAMHGASLYLDTPSHTGTENLMVAAATTPGRTVIENAAMEPEVVDVASFLCAMGAHIRGAGTGRIVVEGVNDLEPVDYTVMPDRIDAGVLCIAAAITAGSVQLVGGDVFDHFGVAAHKLAQMGLTLTTEGAVTTVTRPTDLHPINVITDPHPGYATDLQPPLMALATQATGTSYLRERVHNARYALAAELAQLGADVQIRGDMATITGPTPLHGAPVVARDLRTGIALVLAGLVATGETVINDAQLIERGHADLPARLAALGAQVSRDEHPGGDDHA